MSDTQAQKIYRVLIIDDNPSIHKDFQTILIEETGNSQLDALRSEVFGSETGQEKTNNIFKLDFASQGKDGFEMVKQALDANNPYQMAFIDMRMPPGWDGLQTIEKIWQVDPGLQVVICTAYSDYSWEEINKKLGKSANLLILKKPFDSAEVAQLAAALTQKWELAKKASLKMDQLEKMVEEKTRELTETNNRLKAEIAERQQTELKLAELLTKVDSVNKEMEDFASIVSHDLKAPLRGIKTLAVWIMDDFGDKFDEQTKERMNLLLERVERMYSLIDGVMQYSRIGQMEEQPRLVDLNHFVPELISMLAPPENIRITIEDSLPAVLCHETCVMQLFQNLLSNAIKYMDKPQGQVKIGCSEQGNFWKFSIADNGPGIAEKDFENIFKMFRSLKVKEEFRGTGVGLTVAQKIVHLYGGNIWVESTVGQGSTFYFTLPKSVCSSQTKETNGNLTCVMSVEP
jgi:signal transduction histidine kinase